MALEPKLLILDESALGARGGEGKKELHRALCGYVFVFSAMTGPEEKKDDRERRMIRGRIVYFCCGRAKRKKKKKKRAGA